MRVATALLVVLLVAPAAARAGEDAPGAHFGVGLNVLQLSLFGIVSSRIPDASIVPVPVEIQANGAIPLGVAATVQVRGIEDHAAARTELLVSAGPRLRIVGRDLHGLYTTVKFGLAGASGSNYDGDPYESLAIVIHPEVGFATAIGRPGLFLAFAGGIRFRAFVMEQPESLSQEWNALGKLLNLYVPVLNITVGFAI